MDNQSSIVCVKNNRIRAKYTAATGGGVGNSKKRHYKKPPSAKNAERERSRVRSLRTAFQTLQSCLPSVPPDTKLSKLDILILATNYIVQLTKTLDEDGGGGGGACCEHGQWPNNEDHNDNKQRCCSTSPLLLGRSASSEHHHHHHRNLQYYHPIKKWPMRSRLYSLLNTNTITCGSSSCCVNNIDSTLSLPLLTTDCNNNNNANANHEDDDDQHHCNNLTINTTAAAEAEYIETYQYDLTYCQHHQQQQRELFEQQKHHNNNTNIAFIQTASIQSSSSQSTPNLTE